MSEKELAEDFDIFKGLEVGGFTFRGVDPHGCATFEHECGEVHRLGPDAPVSLLAHSVRTHKCEADTGGRAILCDRCGRPATHKDSGSEGWHLNYCDECGPYSCPDCGRSFGADKAALLTHRQVGCP